MIFSGIDSGRHFGFKKVPKSSKKYTKKHCFGNFLWKGWPWANTGNYHANHTFWHMSSIKFSWNWCLLLVLFFIPVSVTCSISFCLHFGSKNESKSDLKSIKTEIAGSCCSQGVPRPPQGCPRDPQGLHFGPFGLPKGAQGTPKGSILDHFEGTLPPWAPLGITIGPFLLLFGIILVHVGASQPTEAKKT